MVISKKSSQMIYHEETCPYVQRMNKKYSRNISIHDAEEQGYHPCAYCGGLHGKYVKMRDYPAMFGKLLDGISVSYDRIDRGICFRTSHGFSRSV